ncbi:class I adenylate-forming enzyme family protein [Candidatus Poriferisocius sp.]|uniref:class I adenylate-forming enzyme family protein n=1 Tax=Candidatus Poriferisocius sp. TaxID=3101276 RepID=UPI003B596C44
MSTWIEVTTYGDLLVRATARYGDGDAVVFPDRRHSFASLEAAARRSARSLLGLGVRPKDRVGILMPNCMDFVEVMFGAALIGAVPVPINARFKGRELAYVTENADLKVLVTSDIIDQHTDYVVILHDCLPGLADAPDPAHLNLDCAPELTAVVLLGDSSPAGMVERAAFEALADHATDDEVELLRSQVAIRDPALMIYTSGTTAEPKGCPLNHEALVRTAVTACRTRFELTGQDVFWDPLPLFHMSSILPLIGCLDAGSSYVTMTHFEPGAAIAQMRDEKATVCFSTFPPVTQAMINHPDWDAEEFQRIRLMNNVAPPDALRAIHAQLPWARHTNAYGLTECGGVVAFSGPEDPPETWAVASGRPFRGIEVKIKDLETREAVTEPNQRGEIWVRGYNLFEGYHKDPAKNAECFDDDGWFFTGDIGALDPDGRISYLGRTKDMLKVGGENVAAVEIESYLQTHPAVAIAQVVPLPDEKYQEVPAAFCELKPGAEAGEEELIEFCRGQIAGFKIPRHVRFVRADEWPLSATKIQKFRLAEKLRAELGL